MNKRKRLAVMLAAMASIIMLAWVAGLVHVDTPGSDGALGVNIGTDAHYCNWEFWAVGSTISCEVAH